MMQEKEPIKIIMRKQNPVQSEIGEVDATAQYEFLRNRNFYYQIFPGEDCLVECDEEPVRPLNQEALEIVLQIALMFNCTIPDEVQIMRKTVIDGSNTSAFQRTAVIGLDGYLEYKGKKIEITGISLEEDAASIVDEKNDNVTYRLNRLGVPLVEIGTGLLIGYYPEEIQEIAYFIGMICRSTGKVKRGIGTVRQDVNVSIKNGARVEIKGIQELGLLSKVIELEVQRQLSLPEVKEETRATNPDGTTKFTRPLPGASRMYPESDLGPILITKELMEKIEKSLPETWDKKLKRFKEKLKLSDELANQIIKSDYLDLFEKTIREIKIEPRIIATTFVSVLKDLGRRNVPIENLKDEHFIELFKLVRSEKLAKEAITIILEKLAQYPEKKMLELIKELKFWPISKNELIILTKSKIEENREKLSDRESAYKFLMGVVMSEVRGRIDGETVNKIVKEEINKHFFKK